MNYTDTQLKQALAKMLPQCFFENGELYIFDADFAGLDGHRQVCETELLHLCWLVEETLFRNTADWAGYRNMIIQIVAKTSHNTFPSVYLHASWQQRVESLAEVKGIEI